jgi:FKBP-type peptidyl-prolyl cis-trans isomerase FklB
MTTIRYCRRQLEQLGQLLFVGCLSCLSCFVCSCSESDDEDLTGEFANWQERNDAFFFTLEDSLHSNSALWSKWKSYTKNARTTGANTDYVYAKLVQKGDGGDSPLYTDTVRIAYRGRLIPSASYPQGYVFDQTFVGNYDIRTTEVYDASISAFTDGFATALQHMHRGDRYLVYVPYALGYGTSDSSSGKIPGCSVLVFDIVLIDFASGTDKLVSWSARQL